MDGVEHEVPRWDLIIAHPPCTELCASGQRWFKEGWKDYKLQRMAIAFFYRFVMADCDKIAIENPVGVMSTAYRKPDQIINPWQFGHPEQKKTCLWLKGLQPLKATNEVEPIATWCPSGSYSKKHGEQHRGMFTTDRARNRAKTFEGVAQAMAEQWGGIADGESED